MPRTDRRSRSARWAVLGLVATWITAPATRGDPPSPETILRANGLIRVGTVYGLKEEDDLKNRGAEIQMLCDEWEQGKGQLAESLAALDRAQLRYQELLRKQEALEEEWQAVSDPSEHSSPSPDFHSPPPMPDFGPPRPGFDGPPPGEMKGFGPRGREEAQRRGRLGEIRRRYGYLQTERVALEAQIVRGQFSTDDVAGQLESKLREIQSRLAEASKLDEAIRARYATLAAAPEVKRALATINATSRPPVTLGPRVGAAKGLQAIANELIEAEALMQRNRGKFELKGKSRLTGLTGAAETLQHDLGVVVGRLQMVEHDAEARKKMIAEQVIREQTLAEELGRSNNASQRGRLTALLDSAKARSEKFRVEQIQARKTIREVLDQVAATRRDYLRIVALLREALDDPKAPLDRSTDDSRARQEILKFSTAERWAQIQSIEQISRRLKEYEKLIRTYKIPIDSDKTILWVDATLNGKSGQTMIVDPAAEDVRLSARVAAEVGARPEDGDPTIEFTTIDGRTIPARRVRLASVQVGPCSATDVECVVMPEGYGESTSRLGESFLKRFSTKVDAENGMLVLTQVLVKPISRVAKGSTTKTAASP